ncbi:MAG: hypothetical protein LBF04_04235 [Prevotellaceae bacterium]|jgi:hypothetical protein|nr:hypothetical protein [Prevotellaceae bacterium]
MQNLDSQKIINRFFQALYALKEKKIIRGKHTFVTKHEINPRNFYRLEKDMSRDMFQTAWLSYLVEDYGISPSWLLTGCGDMFIKKQQ